MRLRRRLHKAAGAGSVEQYAKLRLFVVGNEAATPMRLVVAALLTLTATATTLYWAPEWQAQERSVVDEPVLLDWMSVAVVACLIALAIFIVWLFGH